MGALRDESGVRTALQVADSARAVNRIESGESF